MPNHARTEKGPTPVIVSTGVDLVDVARIEALVEREGNRFLERIYSSAERAYCMKRGRPAEALGSRFAAKEAVMKCLGTGWSDGVTFTQIEVLREETGAVGIRMTGRAAEVAAELGIRRVHLSLSHTAEQAIAMAVAEG